MTDTRQAILDAAVELMRDGSGQRPSVRAVAARAGVGASTLRHHFPTQQSLIRAALEAMYATALPDERIRDTRLPARDRLAECLSNLLIPLGQGEQAQRFWLELFSGLVDTDGSGYAVVAALTEQRLEAWLRVLQDEGALPRGEVGLAVTYLLTVVDGLAIARSLPAGQYSPVEESAVIGLAIDTVLDGRAMGPPTALTHGR